MRAVPAPTLFIEGELHMRVRGTLICAVGLLTLAAEYAVSEPVEV